jgi:hypothetical protein
VVPYPALQRRGTNRKHPQQHAIAGHISIASVRLQGAALIEQALTNNFEVPLEFRKSLPSVV